MLRLIALSIAIAIAVAVPGNHLHSSRSVSTQDPATALDFIDTGIENGSPLWYEIVDHVIRLNLIYDHER